MLRKDDRNRKKERERRKRANGKYGQAKLKHAKRGILSTVTAGIVVIVLTTLVFTSYKSGGTVSQYAGSLGLVSVILSGVGIRLGIRGFREREKNYLTCKIGLWCNSIFLLSFILIFFRGLFL